MLVLSRKIGQKIWIGNNISVTVTSIDRDKVRLGISAPADVAVFREELLIDRDNSPVTPTKESHATR